MLGAEGRARGGGGADTDTSFCIPRDSLEPDSGVSAMGGARPGCKWEGSIPPWPPTQAWKPSLELKGQEVAQLRDQVQIPPWLQTPMDHVGGTDVPS